VVPLDDEHDLAIPEPMDLLVGPPHVGEDSQSVGLLVKKYRVVRRYELLGSAADEDAPRVLADQLPDKLGGVAEVMRVVAHGMILPTRAETVG
jgi:hypothetical protein